MTNVCPLPPGGFCTGWYPTLAGRPALFAQSTTVSPTWQAWTEVAASCPIEAQGIIVAIRHSDAGTGVQEFRWQIGIGSAGNEWPIMEDIFRRDNVGVIANGKEHSFFLPLRIPKGARVVARQMVTVSNSRIGMCLSFVGGGPGMPKGYQKAIRLGADTATQVANGTTQTAWTEVTASCPADIAAIMVNLFQYTTGFDTAFNMEIGQGASGQEVLIAHWTGTYRFAAAYDADCSDYNYSIIPVSIPKGRRIAFRGDATTASVVARGQVLGFVP